MSTKRSRAYTTVEVYLDDRGSFRFRLIARNGRILNHRYNTEASAKRAALDLVARMKTATVAVIVKRRPKKQ